MHKGNFVCSSDFYNVIDCEICKFKHIYPLPSDKELEFIYKNEYYTSVKPDYIKMHERDKSWWQHTYDSRLEKIKSAINSGG